MVSCGRHPNVDARHACAPCGTTLCDACVTLVGVAPRQVGQCTACGAMVAPIVAGSAAARARARAVMPGTLASRLPSALRYLKGGDLLLALAGLAVLVSVLRLAGTYVMVITLGLESLVAFNIVTTSAAGRDTFDAPAGDDVDDVFSAAMRYLVALAPLIASLIWFAVATGGETAIPSPGDLLAHLGPPAIAVVVSIALWPLLTVIAAMSRSYVAILNPVVWVKTLGILGRDYAIGALAFYGIVLVEALVWWPVLARVVGALAVPVVGTAIVLFLGYLPMALRARILGEMTRPYLDP